MSIRGHRMRERLADEFGDTQTEENFALAGLSDDVIDSILRLERGEFGSGDALEAAREIIASVPVLRPQGYHYYPKDGDEVRDPSLLVDGVFDRHANSVTERTLQRENRVVRAGNGGGTGKAKDIKPRKIVVPVPETEVEPNPPRFTVGGLTKGEVAVLRDEPGFASQTLLKVASEILATKRWPDAEVEIPPVKRRLTQKLEVYGLPSRKIELLRIHRGFATRILIQAAHSKNPRRIAAMDGANVRDFSADAEKAA